MYIEESINKYISDLSAKLPAPGGGSASAMVSVTGIALLCMVANYTVDKKGYEDCQEQIKEILKELKRQEKRLMELIDLDVEEYKKVSEVYKLPRNTDIEKQNREIKIQECLKSAFVIPFEIMNICSEGFLLAEKLSKIGNKNLISDVACGVAFLKAGLEGGKFNVDINLASINDTKFVEEKRRTTESILHKCRINSETILDSIKL